MKCPKCGAELDGKFCTNCGAPAPTKPVCAKCGAELEGKFCTVCGTPAQQEPVAEPVTEAPADVQPTVEETPVNEPAQQPAEAAEPEASTQQLDVQPMDFGSYNNQPNSEQSPYTNENPTPDTKPNGKKPMSGGKIAIIIVSIVVGLIIILGIIIGVVACNIVKNVAGSVSDSVSDASNIIESVINEYDYDYEYNYDDDDDDYSYDDTSDDDFDDSDDEEAESQGFEYYIDDGKAVITDVNMETAFKTCLSGSVFTVPSELDGYKVKEIEYLYLYNPDFDDVKLQLVIPGTIETIGDYAIGIYEDDFNEVIIEDGVKTIEDYAFIFCEETYKITVPSSVTNIADYSLGYSFDDGVEEVKISGFTLCTEKGSAAESYAKTNGITVEYTK